MLTPDLSPSNLPRFVRQSKDVVRDHLHNFSQAIDGYVGKYFNRRQMGRQDDPTNARFEFISLFLPEVAAGRPRWGVECDISGQGDQVADAMSLALAGHAQDARYGKLFKMLGVDYCLNWGMVKTFSERREDPRGLLGGGPLYAPITRRVDQERCFWDINGDSFHDAAFRGHTEVRTRRSIEDEGEEQGWDMRVVAALAEYSERSSLSTKRDANWSDRDVIAYDVIWVPGATEDMVRELGYSTEKYRKELAENPYQYNGWLFYAAEIGRGDMHAYIKPPEPNFGPAMGPYIRFESYPVPNSTFTSSVLQFTAAQQELLNRAERAITVQEEEYKSIMAYETEDAEVARKITDTPSGEVVALPMLYKSNGQPLFAQFRFGEPDPNMYNTIERRRMMLDRNLGLSDEQKGNTNTDATATASSIAASAGQSRMGWQVQSFMDAASDVGYANGWFMYHDPQYARSLGQEGRDGRFVEYNVDGEIVAIADPVFRGGVGEDEDFTYDDFAFRFDYKSVQFKSEAQRRGEAIEVASFVAQSAPAMIQSPHVRWDEYWEHVGEELDQPWLDRLFDYDKLEEITGIQMEQESKVEHVRFTGGLNRRSSTSPFNLAAPRGNRDGIQRTAQGPGDRTAQGASRGAGAAQVGNGQKAVLRRGPTPAPGT